MKRLILLAVVGIFSSVSLYAQTLTINSSNYTTYLTDPNSSGEFAFKDVADVRNAKIIILASSIPTQYSGVMYSADPSTSNVLANLEEIELSEGHNLTKLVLFGTKIKKVTVKNGTKTFSQLNVQSASLTQNDITLGSNVRPRTIVLHRNFITDLTPIYSMMAPDFVQFQANGGIYNRKRHAGVSDGFINPTNQIREIDMTKFPTATFEVLWIRHNLLERLENINHTKLRTFVINNNLLWSVDLSSVTATPTNYTISPQKPVADMMVEKGAAEDGSQDEVRLYLPAGQSEIFNNNRLVSGSVKLLNNVVATQTIQGTATNKYFKVASVADGTTADLNLYAQKDGFTYQYDTGREDITDPAKRYMEVKVKTYPYIMYINPASKAGVNYYSGTLWLDYDAIVPAKTTVWIVKDIVSSQSITVGGQNTVETQLVMEKIGEPGDLIPAGTAMYVRSDEQAGLYDFQKAWTHDIKGWDGGQTGPDRVASAADTLLYDKKLTTAQEAKLVAQREKINQIGNLLEGYGTDKVFDNKREALILGLENQKGTGRIGFWPFNGTVVPAHRAFISEATYRSKVGDANAKGAIFFFNDPETTGITHIQNSDATTKNDAWYSLDGRQLTGKPTQKGVYIHKGRKEVVR